MPHDPAIVAGREWKEADAAFDTLPKDTDEESQIFLAVEKRSRTAGQQFADIEPTTPAGAAAKLRAVLELYGLDEDTPLLSHRHVRTTLAYLERLAGAAS